ncbi:Hypothetical protein NTJ_09375 [Nesidiocoris tenuis]|uniref:Gustatory receptor n=1 Tax=Nesidiocoris tenuis TaxID=355587 RepID=A0ABN7AX72_9HEMI|nr:Hypothetical protein NTJ_09375 [Nesidiocoris tenuis]
MKDITSKLSKNLRQSQNDLIREFFGLNSFQVKWLSLTTLFEFQFTHLCLTAMGVLNFVIYVISNSPMNHIASKMAAFIFLFIPHLGLGWCYSLRYRHASFQHHVDEFLEIGNTFIFGDEFTSFGYLMWADIILFIPPSICASGILLFAHGLDVSVIVSQLLWVLYFIYVFIGLLSFTIATNLAGYCLQRMTKILSDSPDEKSSKDLVIKYLKNYDALADGCVNVNQYFGPQNLSIILFAFTTLIFQSYFAIGGHLPLFDNIDATLRLVLNGSYFVMMFTIPSFLIVECVMIEREVRI